MKIEIRRNDWTKNDFFTVCQFSGAQQFLVAILTD